MTAGSQQPPASIATADYSLPSHPPRIAARQRARGGCGAHIEHCDNDDTLANTVAPTMVQSDTPAAPRSPLAADLRRQCSSPHGNLTSVRYGSRHGKVAEVSNTAKISSIFSENSLLRQGHQQTSQSMRDCSLYRLLGLHTPMTPSTPQIVGKTCPRARGKEERLRELGWEKRHSIAEDTSVEQGS